ncbi:uncharacterized protein LOC111040228 [Myzus persicae]|uniref:uncharacterized protein LOC111040228 n=1 Tax=Myzus persicae TaxID=13164 RepID=UPI000B9393A1|nr:uncharacterized protein LOC111040228 [Myzus persicae]
MGLKCCVDSCQLEANSWNIQLHPFPLNSTLHNKWIAAIKKYDQFVPNRNLRICSGHFRLKDRLRSSFGYCKLKLGAVPSIFVNNQQSLIKVGFAKYVEIIKNYPTSVSAEEMLSKKTLELIVQYGVFTDGDLKARHKREKFWDEYLDGYYENEKQLFQNKYNYLKKLYEKYQSGIVPDISSLQLEKLKLK